MREILNITRLSESDFKRQAAAAGIVHIPLEQTPNWGNFDEQIENRTFLGTFLYSDHKDRAVAIASATLYRQKGRCWIWIKHGPLFSKKADDQMISKLWKTLQKQYRSIHGVRPVFIRLSTDYKFTKFRQPFEQTMYDQSAIIDLSKTEEQLLSEMSKSGRQGIRKASSHNVLVKEITRKYSEIFTEQCYPILAETARRAGFGIHPASLYVKMLETLPDHTRLYAAWYKDAIVAWTITTEYNKTALYYYSASSHAARDSEAQYALQWEIIKQLKKRGNTIYDLMGISKDPSSHLARLTTFKLKFAKEITTMPKTYDLPLMPLKYTYLNCAIRLIRGFKRS